MSSQKKCHRCAKSYDYSTGYKGYCNYFCFLEKEKNVSYDVSKKFQNCKQCNEALDLSIACQTDGFCTTSCKRLFRYKKGMEKELDKREEEGDPVIIEQVMGLSDQSDWMKKGHLNFGASTKGMLAITQHQYNGGYEK